MDLIKNLAFIWLAHQHNRRADTLEPIYTQINVTKIMMGQPIIQPDRIDTHCQSCRDHLLRHSSTPGIGCRRPGCLCLETPTLIRDAA